MPVPVLMVPRDPANQGSPDGWYPWWRDRVTKTRAGPRFESTTGKASGMLGAWWRLFSGFYGSGSGGQTSLGLRKWFPNRNSFYEMANVSEQLHFVENAWVFCLGQGA